MKEQDKIGLLLIAITTVFCMIVGEFLIENWRGIVLMAMMFVFIPFIQWAIKKQKEVIKKFAESTKSGVDGE